jgi:hypothetical protein
MKIVKFFEVFENNQNRREFFGFEMFKTNWNHQILSKSNPTQHWWQQQQQPKKNKMKNWSFYADVNFGQEEEVEDG